MTTIHTMPRTQLEPEHIEVSPKEAGLIIVDMQNDFVDKDGALYGEASAKIIPSINYLIKTSRDSDVKVFHTQDWHLPSDVEFKLWPKHCVKGTWGAELTGIVNRDRNDVLVKKGTIDPWLKSNLASHIRKNNIKTLIVTGTVANICVLHAVAGAVIRGVRVIVPVDSVAPLTRDALRPTLEQFKNVYKCSLTDARRITYSNSM
ncbi:MAG: cysteine hydrolase family protein [Nitrososphaerales archaeon]